MRPPYKVFEVITNHNSLVYIHLFCTDHLASNSIYKHRTDVAPIHYIAVFTDLVYKDICDIGYQTSPRNPRSLSSFWADCRTRYYGTKFSALVIFDSGQISYRDVKIHDRPHKLHTSQ
jgi:hypothetical protein